MLHVEVDRRELLPLVKGTTTISKPTDARPILRNLLLVATEEALEVYSTNMIVNLWFRLPVGEGLTITSTGQTAVRAFDLQKVLETSRCERLIIKDQFNRCHIRGENTKFALVTEDARDFPKILRFSDKKPYITKNAGLFYQMLNRSVYCAHDERSFFLMHGLLLKVAQKQLQVVATNGQRLGVCTNYYDSETEELDESIVIPAEEATNLKKVAGPEDEIHIQWGSRSLNVRGPKGEVCILALNGSFPDYRRGVPDNSKRIEFDREKLIRVLTQTQVFRGASTNLIKLDITSKKLIFKTLERDIGDAQIEYEIDWKHEPMTLVLNPTFMLATAKSMRGDKIFFELEGEMTQTVLREQRDDSMQAFCVYAVARQ